MRSIPRFLALAFLLAAFAFVGCGKQETTPSPTPTPTPPPTATASGNKDCKATGAGNDTCKLTTDEVAAQSGMPGHGCAGFDETSAIVITKGAVASGKFKKIHIKKEKDDGNSFDIKVEACPGSSGNPFPYAKQTDKDNWESGDLNASVADKSHYHLTMTVKTAKGMKKSDPHIVIDGGGSNR